MQSPPLHESPIVQGLPSLHMAPSASAAVQPVAMSQLSTVHGLPSSHITAVAPVHKEPAQCSPSVHALLSVQAAAFPKCTQAPVSHASSVQGLPSLQLGVNPCTHAPRRQASPKVQESPSLQVAPSALTEAQPDVGAHVSVVQGLPSLQGVVEAPTHPPPAQCSPMVQALPSVQSVSFGTCKQSPRAQLSFVHTLKSSQGNGAPLTQTAPAHASPNVHGLLSLHAAASAFVQRQPDVVSQLSTVQGLASSQDAALAPTHAPPAQCSPVVHALLSVHAAATGRCTHLPATHASLVQGFSSSQSGYAPLTQIPPLHKSPKVHGSLSAQGCPSAFVEAQPVSVSHVSVVHGLPSSQVTLFAPAQLPPRQCSPAVHALLSVHVAAFGAWTQLPPAHVSFVHGFWSSQFGYGPLLHLLAPQRSPNVQGSPSLQAMPSAELAVQPIAASQLSTVHGLPSSQVTMTPGAQLPFMQTSPMVHVFASLQVALAGRCTHPFPCTHRSVVHGESSVQKYCQAVEQPTTTNAPQSVGHLTPSFNESHTLHVPSPQYPQSFGQLS